MAPKKNTAAVATSSNLPKLHSAKDVAIYVVTQGEVNKALVDALGNKSMSEDKCRKAAEILASMNAKLAKALEDAVNEAYPESDGSPGKKPAKVGETRIYAVIDPSTTESPTPKALIPVHTLFPEGTTFKGEKHKVDVSFRDGGIFIKAAG